MDHSAWYVFYIGYLHQLGVFNGIAGVIIMMTQLLSLGLRRIRQPKVIAEVLGGILLGT